MDNSLKLLMSEDDLHKLKKLSIELESYINTVLKPLKDTLANEARRAINLNRSLEVAIREGDKLIGQVKVVIGERV